jgi:TonB family protein
MNALLIYLAEVSACFAMLFAVYWFFLKRETFFQVNRFYLLAAVLLSGLIPLIPFRWSPGASSAPIMVMLEPVMITPERVVETFRNHLQWMEVAVVVYLTGVILFVLRFGLQLFQLARITRRSGIRHAHGERVVFVDRGYSPFSFFNLVFINEAVVPAAMLPTILEHERVHIRQHHTADMIVIELAILLQWFNPLIWIAGREMKTIHEYLADEGVLQNGISRPLYQQMILDETMGIQVNNLTNNFNVSLVKKRIAMMTKSKSGMWARGKILLALPVLLVTGILLTAGAPDPFTGPVVPGGSENIQADLDPQPELVFQDKQKQQTQIKYAPVDTTKLTYTVVEKMPSYTGGQEAMIQYLVANIQYPPAAKANKVQGTVFVTFVVEPDGTVTNVKILRGIGSGCDEEAQRVVKMMPKWNPGEQKGKPVRVQFNLPIKFKLDADKKEVKK